MQRDGPSTGNPQWPTRLSAFGAEPGTMQRLQTTLQRCWSGRNRLDRWLTPQPRRGWSRHGHSPCTGPR
jgi:hypothetical protein